MQTFQFTKDLASGNDQIDDLHRKLIESLRQAVSDGDFKFNKASIAELLIGIDKPVLQHFRKEIKVLEKLGYADVRKHAYEHVDYYESLINFVVEYLWDEDKSAADMNDTIKELLMAHIKEEKKEFSTLANNTSHT